MALLLQRRLNGTNEVVNVKDGTETEPNVVKFTDLLAEMGMQSTEGLTELAQVLKVPFKNLVNLCAGGLVEGPAQHNITDYMRNYRLCGAQIDFLRRQQGEAGTKNVPVSEDSDFKDNCG